jgi:hypothetical protein
MSGPKGGPCPKCHDDPAQRELVDDIGEVWRSCVECGVAELDSPPQTADEFMAVIEGPVIMSGPMGPEAEVWCDKYNAEHRAHEVTRSRADHHAREAATLASEVGGLELDLEQERQEVAAGARDRDKMRREHAAALGRLRARLDDALAQVALSGEECERLAGELADTNDALTGATTVVLRLRGERDAARGCAVTLSIGLSVETGSARARLPWETEAPEGEQP